MWVSSIRLCLNQPCFLYPQRLNLVKSLSTHREENKFKYLILELELSQLTRIYLIISIHKTCFFFFQFKNFRTYFYFKYFIVKKKKTIFCDTQIKTFTEGFDSNHLFFIYIKKLQNTSKNVIQRETFNLTSHVKCNRIQLYLGLWVNSVNAY